MVPSAARELSQHCGVRDGVSDVWVEVSSLGFLKSHPEEQRRLKEEAPKEAAAA